MSNAWTSFARRHVAELFQGRYQLLGPLSSAGEGLVFLACDLRRGGLRVSLKLLRANAADEGSVLRLREEFLILSALEHPGKPKAYDFGVDPETGDPFFTYEFIQGSSWFEAMAHIDVGTPAGLEAFLNLLSQVLRTLCYIHDQGFVHGDLTSHNILITGDPGDKASGLSTRITDFALASKAGLLPDLGRAGAPHYTSPESLQELPPDARSDLYSLGCVLYQLLVGCPPFGEGSRARILEAHLARKPAFPSDVDSRIDPRLGAFVMRLLEKCPDDRFPSAAAALSHLCAAYNLGWALESPVTLRSYLERGLLTLRSAACDSLSLLVEQALFSPRSGEGAAPDAPAPRMVLVEGEEGSGKSTVVGVLRQRLQVLGVSFITADCARPSIEGPTPPNARNSIVAMADSLLQRSNASPLVLHLRDMHLASRRAVELVTTLLAMMRSSRAARSRLVVLATSRPGDGQVSSLFDLFRKSSIFAAQGKVFPFQPLHRDELPLLYEQAFHRPAEDWAPLFKELSPEPIGLEEVISEARNLFVKGRLFRGPDGWGVRSVEEVAPRSI